MGFSILFLFSIFLACESAVPVVLWHGMGDSCCSSGSLGKIIKLLEQEIPGAEVLSLKFGKNTLEDIESGYFLNSNKQVELACNEIASNPAFQDGYHAIGFSQGGQFLRAVAQRCPSPPMKVLVTLGGQHQGVYGLPHCRQPEPIWCDEIRKLLNEGAYTSFVQDYLVQAQYWHDPLDEEAYRNNSIFLADINNEKAEKNESYAENLQKLEKLVLVLFQNDSMVDPRESSWFGFYAPGQSKEVLSFQDTELFTKDTIGLRPLVASGKVDFIAIEGDHLEFSEEWFIETIIEDYLKKYV